MYTWQPVFDLCAGTAIQSPREIETGAVIIRKHFSVAVRRRTFHLWRVSAIIYPRSPRETMDGWHYLPRYIDKIRLHLAGKLNADYQENLGKGFDGMWLKYSGITHAELSEVVRESITDGEVCDWIRFNVKKTDAEKAAHWLDVLSRPLADDAQAVARLKMRKEQAGIAHREEIKCFVDMIDGDEKRI